MPTSSNEPFDSSDSKQLAKFRLAVAGFIKNLICARENSVTDRQFSESTAPWFRNQQRSKASCRVLLNQARARFLLIQDRFCGYLDSEPYIDFSETPQSLTETFFHTRNLLLDFTTLTELDLALAQSENSSTIPWHQVARWEHLSRLRFLLDRLPASLSPPVHQSEYPIFLNDSTFRCVGSECSFSSLSARGKKLTLAMSGRSSLKLPNLWDEVWGDRQDMSDDAIRSLVKRLNQCFKEVNFPWKLSTAGGLVSWVPQG